MSQTIIDFMEDEEEIISKLKKRWSLNKQKTIRRIVKEFRENSR